MNRYIIPILLVILSASVYVMVIDPTYADIRQQQAKEAELVNFLADAKQANAKLAKIKESYAAFPSGSEQALSTILPDKLDPIRFIIEVEAVARIHGLYLKGPHAEPSGDTGANASKYTEDKLTFSVSAPYPIFHEFLKDIQDSLALRDMTNVSFTADPTSGDTKNQRPDSVVYNYNVSLMSYSLHP